jgi:flagellar basal body-associated protein FliL
MIHKLLFILLMIVASVVALAIVWGLLWLVSIMLLGFDTWQKERRSKEEAETSKRLSDAISDYSPKNDTHAD